MDETDYTDQGQSGNASAARWILPGIAVGAAVALAIVATTRKRIRWEKVTDVVTDNKAQLLKHGKSILDRVRLIYEEGSKLVEEAAELWTHGRKLVRRSRRL